MDEKTKKKIRENAKGIINVFKKMLNIDKFKILFSCNLDSSIGAYVYGVKLGYFGERGANIHYSNGNASKYSISMPMPMSSFQKPRIDEMLKLEIISNFHSVAVEFKPVDLRDAAKIYGCSEEDVEEALAEHLVKYATSWRRLSFGANPSPMQGPLAFEEIMIKADLEGDI